MSEFYAGPRVIGFEVAWSDGEVRWVVRGARWVIYAECSGGKIGVVEGEVSGRMLGGGEEARWRNELGIAPVTD